MSEHKNVVAAISVTSIVRLNLIAVLSFCISMAAEAFPVLDIDAQGQLAGARGVQVLGNLYDVRFRTGNCIEVFSGCDAAEDFLFQTEDMARAASEALKESVLIDTPEADFSSDPRLVLGCDDREACGIFTPFDMRVDEVLTMEVGIFDDNEFHNVYVSVAQSVSYWITGEHLGYYNVFAVWEPHVASVDEPHVIALLLSGFLALGTIKGVECLKTRQSRKPGSRIGFPGGRRRKSIDPHQTPWPFDSLEEKN